MGTPDTGTAASGGQGLGDLLDQLLGSRSATVEAARQVRPVVFAALQGSYRVLIDADPDDPVSPVERAAIALRVSATHRSDRLVAWCTEVLQELDADSELVAAASGTGGSVLGEGRASALMRFAAALAENPAAVRPEALGELRAVGLDDRGIVVVCQVVAFTSYLVRVVAGLAAAATTAGSVSTVDVSLPAGFSLAARQWAAHLSVVTDADASPEQWAVLAPDGRPTQSQYYRTLAHDPASLVQRSRLYDETMYGEHGLDRGDRELVALAVSMINGCQYCASVHARRLAQLTGSRAAVGALLDGDAEFIATPRRQALVRAAAALTAVPPAFGAEDLAALRHAGLREPEIFDAINVAAIFAWANRLMLVLGQSQPASGAGSP